MDVIILDSIPWDLRLEVNSLPMFSCLVNLYLGHFDYNDSTSNNYTRSQVPQILMYIQII